MKPTDREIVGKMFNDVSKSNRRQEPTNEDVRLVRGKLRISQSCSIVRKIKLKFGR